MSKLSSELTADFCIVKIPQIKYSHAGCDCKLLKADFGYVRSRFFSCLFMSNHN